uniref:Uncharacterized protein n=1 Tax=Nymphaea colorata TaxID=210225 RepID=A0A5K1CB67_9MAGN
MTTFQMAANCRHRLSPPLHPEYFGNAIQSIATTTEVGDLLKREIGWVAGMIHRGVVAHGDATIRGMVDEWEKAPREGRGGGGGRGRERREGRGGRGRREGRGEGERTGRGGGRGNPRGSRNREREREREHRRRGIGRREGRGGAKRERWSGEGGE